MNSSSALGESSRSKIVFQNIVPRLSSTRLDKFCIDIVGAKGVRT